MFQYNFLKCTGREGLKFTEWRNEPSHAHDNDFGLNKCYSHWLSKVKSIPGVNFRSLLYLTLLLQIAMTDYKTHSKNNISPENQRSNDIIVSRFDSTELVGSIELVSSSLL